jgi:hypothetical protein
MVWSKVKVVATGRIVDADFFAGFLRFFLCGGGVVFRCFTGGFGESEWREMVFCGQ